MKQTFTPLAVPKKEIAQRLAALRALLKQEGWDGFIVPHENEFLTEYLAPHDERLAFISGFSGSAGAALILPNKALLWTDGRYQLQAQEQSALYDVRHSIQSPLRQWLKDNPPKKIAFDARLHTIRDAQAMEGLAQAVGRNFIDEIWHEQPAPPTDKLIKYELAFAGVAAKDKIALCAKNLTAPFVLSDPISIAWLLNMRGTDIPHTPIALCTALLHPNKRVQFFVDKARLDAETKTHLAGIDICPPETFAETLRALPEVALDKSKTSYWIFQQVQKANLTWRSDPCLLPKAAKNKTEVQGMRNAHIRDGAALTQFLFWLEQQSATDEITATKKLEQLRAQQKNFFDISFDTIAGAGPHGAIIHYRADETTNRALQQGELFLLDSGGQYLDGTTDITRTISIGTPNTEQQRNFTLVLQGHITLASAIFPRGSSGAQLDILARRPLWEAGLDFDHGTGHGVGAFLSVHEGPQSISPRGSSVPLLEGMIISNEPGYYKAGDYGIRIENLVAVVAKDNNFLALDTISCAPIDRRLILAENLSAKELNWLNTYHAWVKKTLTPLVPEDCAAWLKAATAPMN